MTKKPNTQPSNLEMQVLSVLWDRGPSTVRELLDAMPDGKQRAYTTVLTVMQNMEKKGLVSRTSRGTAHVYRPVGSRKRTLGPMLKGMLNNVFGGSVSTAMQGFLNEADVSEEELDALRKMIDERRQVEGRGKGKE
ncbi:MAG: BlaI/MecI/CopY family transcriptional regulator [Verrucomicrobiia bacterium]|jgi:BlaI family penicillinase repressor